MYFADLSPYEYDSLREEMVLNVGWLSVDQDYRRGPTPAGLLSRLEELVQSPVRVHRGLHLCEFCPPPRRYEHLGKPMFEPAPGTAGTGQIRVQGANGLVYAAPVLITHYIGTHDYLPPQEFIDAVLS
jgi:hypothetical protein